MKSGRLLGKLEEDTSCLLWMTGKSGITCDLIAAGGRPEEGTEGG